MDFHNFHNFGHRSFVESNKNLLRISMKFENVSFRKYVPEPDPKLNWIRDPFNSDESNLSGKLDEDLAELAGNGSLTLKFKHSSLEHF